MAEPPTKLDDFKPYLHERWAEGCTNAWTLWEEIKTHGYTGGYGAVRAHLQPFRTSPTAPAARPPSPRTVTSWIRGLRNIRVRSCAKGSPGWLVL
ncbi:hypothetical protein ACWCQM_28140 [Streptomyces sp. NPDC002125]